MFKGGRTGLETAGDGGTHITTAGWTLEGLLKDGKNFKPIERISALGDPKDIERKVREYEEKNIPLIVEDCHKHEYWNEGLFTVEHLERANSDEGGEYDATTRIYSMFKPLCLGISVRNCISRVDKKMKFSEFDSKCRESPKFAVLGGVSDGIFAIIEKSLNRLARRSRTVLWQGFEMSR